jgi:hypothetical protein
MYDVLFRAPGMSQTHEEIVAGLRLVKADRMAVNGCDTCDSLDEVRAIRRILAEGDATAVWFLGHTREDAGSSFSVIDRCIFRRRPGCPL